MRSTLPRRKRFRGTQRGYVLIAVLFALTLAIIAMAAVAPAIKTQIKRDREQELRHRGKQYVRAIQLYYRKFGHYPASIEQLEDTNHIRFLRRKYADPITGKNEWKLIRLGQAKPRKRPSFLGPAAGGGAGITPASSLPGATQTSTGTSTGSGIVNASDISRPIGGGQTLGGAPIVGVASLSEKESLLELDGNSHYNEIEFVYDPLFDTGGRPGQTQPAVPGQPGPSQQRDQRGPTRPQ